MTCQSPAFCYRKSTETCIADNIFLRINKDNILDTRSVNGKDANAYELRIYIHDEAEDWYGKHYHYRVVLKKDN